MQIGPYVVQEELARGGMGVVYRALDPRDQTAVALKLLKVDSELGRRRLSREARAMAALVHPNVVPLLDSGVHEGEPYLVLPFLPGESLQERLDRLGPLPIEEAIEFTVQVGDGLRAAHAAGLLHRDVKPANVLLDVSWGGSVRLTDFGLAKQIGPGVSQTASLSVKGRFLGTPGYWPLEQAFGRLDQIGPPSDVYGLVALLYALLTGDPPRAAESLVEAIRIFEDPVVPAKALRAEVPDWLDALIGRGLVNEPAERPLLSEVLALLSGRGVAPAPDDEPDEAEPAPRWVSLVAAVVTVAALGALAWALLRTPASGDVRTEGGPQPAAAAEAEEIQDHWEKGVAALQRLDFTSAELAFRRVLELAPEHPGSLINRGACLLNQDRYLEALDDLRLAVEVAPNNYLAHKNLALTLLRLGRYEVALSSLARAIELAPGEPLALREELLQEKALIQRKLLTRAEAEGLLTQAVKRSKARDYEEGARLVDRALRKDGAFAAAYAERAFVFLRQRRYSKAAQAADEALRLDPGLEAGLLNRGAARAGMGHYAQALDDLNDALARNPTLVGALASKSQVLELMGRSDESLAVLLRAMELAPQDPKIRFRCSQQLLAAQRYREALEALEPLILKRPKSGAPYLLCGNAKLGLGDYDGAVAEYDRALSRKLDPTERVVAVQQREIAAAQQR